MGISAAVAGVGLVSGYMSSQAAGDAADTQADAAREAARLQMETADKNRALSEKMYQEGVQRQSPWLQAGSEALGRLREGLGAGGQFTRGFQFDQNQDPSYQWRFNQGQRALEAGAAARGGLFTGGQAQALQNYGQNAASQEYQNAFNRFQTERGAQYNMLTGMSTVGQNAAAGAAAAGNQLAANNATLMSNAANLASGYNTQGANAQAAGQIQQGNQFSNLLGNAAGMYQTWANAPSQNPWLGATNQQAIGGYERGVLNDSIRPGGYFGE